MKIQATASKLSKALANVSRIAVSKATLPILNNVLIRVDNKKVSLTTTNLDMAMIDFLPVSESEDGVITVPARLLTEFVSNLPKTEVIELTSENDKVSIVAGKYSSTINGAPADDFPELPEINESEAVTFKIGVDDFKVSLGQILIAVSHDLARPAFTGVYFDTNNNILNITATDGYRLATKKLIDNVKSEVKAIVPANSLQEVLRSLTDDISEIEITFNSDLIRFRLGEIELISKLIDASFPDYTQLIPKDFDYEVELGREELIRTAKLARLFARSSNDLIICETTPPNTFSIRSVANEFGENCSTIETPVEKEGKISLNSRFLLDTLNALDEPVIKLQFSSNPSTPSLLRNQKSDKYSHIVMPVNK